MRSALMSGAVIVVGVVMGCSTSEPSAVREPLTVEDEASPPAETSESETAPSPTCSACLPEPLGLNTESPMAGAVSTVAISGCGSVEQDVVQRPAVTVARSCTGSIACDASGGGMKALLEALADPDVEAAVAAGDKFYGRDMVPVDGSRIEVVWKGTRIGLGFPMVEDAEHPIPGGLKRLYKWLESTAPALACTPAAPSGG